MPYKTKPLPKKGKVQVVNVDTGQVMAKSTTPLKATKQINLLNQIHKKNKK